MLRKHSYFLFLILLALSWSCSTEEQSQTKEKAVWQEPEVINLSDPSKGKPLEVVRLTNVPSPQIVKVPQKSGGFYVKNRGTEAEEVIPFEVPVVNPLPTLTDGEGREVLDDEGNPYLLGSGGVTQFTSYTSDNGLGLDAVNCAFLDSRGHMWFGTNGGGVSRFDGRTFTNYTTAEGLGGNQVRSIVEDSNGVIWIGALDGGITKYDGKEFTSYSTEEGLLDNQVFTVIVDQDEAIWAGTLNGGVAKFDGEKFSNYTVIEGLPNDGVISLLEDEDGFIWIGTNGGGLSRWDGNTFTTFNESDGLPGNRIRSLYQDPNGLIWIGIIGAGVTTYDGKAFKHYDQSDGLAGLIVRQVITTSKGETWLVTNEGASKFNQGKFITYREAHGLPTNNLNSLAEDSNGKLWFGTEGGGITRYEGEGFVNFSTEQGLAEEIVMSIEEDQNNDIWFGTVYGGVSHFDGTKFTNYSESQGLADDIVLSIIEDSSGNIWFGTGGGGASRYNGNVVGPESATFSNFTMKQGLAGNDVYGILEDQSGNIWFATDGGGVSKFDGESFTNINSSNGLAGDAILGLEEDHLGNIWIAAIDGGLSRFDGENLINFTTEQGLVDNGVQRVTLDSKDNLWIGTIHGFSFVPKEKLDRLEEIINQGYKESLFENFTVSDGLPNDLILQISELPEGKMAIGTNLGITLFDAPESGRAKLDSLSNIEFFHAQTGFPVRDLTDGQNGMFLDSQGNLWAGTGSNKTSLVRFNYSALNKNTNVPSVAINEIQINETQISWNNLLRAKSEMAGSAISNSELAEEMEVFGRSLSTRERQEMSPQFDKIQFDGITPFFALPENLTLPYKNNQVNINFITNELAKPDLIEYRYYLEGYDQGWSPVVKKSSASFGNIQEGEYTFNVIARYTGPTEGGGGEWSEPAQYSFIVLPPWYRTWWAYLIYAVLLISLLYPFSQYQKRQVIKKEQEKARERELEQAKQIEKAYTELEASHENLKATQSQLIQSEKMASLGELTAGIAHEIQNPLNFVNNFSEVSKELMEEMEAELKKEDTEEVFAIARDIKDNLERISSHGRRADSIVKAMLQHSRTGAGNKEETDINALADEFLRLSYHAIRSKDQDFRTEYKLELDPKLPKVVVIPQDIGKVLLNITNNAFYYANEHDKNLKDPDFKPLVTVKTKKHKKSIEIQIIDNGAGIPDDIKEKVFQPFFTTKPTGKGTGLGLSLSYDIIKSHGGELSAKSISEMKEGETGTIFSIILPLT
ncbi:sensor histidine kinase [Algoriphagus sediminis]|uniref:histidine kinase n=1 Tax=Algoriphagus sediminis TaxID=3057113 RepID=A0ABT7YCH8_9BACT|nr:sensor histidine kinase [Algoriphagus sediminis]MDN3204090.1 two-component regulator propeller domain-containing protein [Algoriphagus sediminis]